MGRKPEQVHVYLYRKHAGQTYEFAIFQRADNLAWWQGISGGVEENETPEQAALRETFEEAGAQSADLYRLDVMSYLPSNIFQASWGRDVVVCPMFFFAMPFDGDIVLSDEHAQVRWLGYEAAEALVYFHDQKTALWELNERLHRGNLIRS